MERRLAAILAADVVGYSRLVRENEEGTLAAFSSTRHVFVEPLVGRHRGRVVKLMGDGYLVEFRSAVDAVNCAIDWQTQILDRDDTGALSFRIGVNLGDIVIEGDDIYGDGVNVAVRLEALAPPGGFCLADAVYEQVRDRIRVRFDDKGQQSLKNIDRPVQVWAWQPQKDAPTRQTRGTAVQDRALTLTVSEFKNLSQDPDQAYVAEGICEDVVTGLSKKGDIADCFPGRRHTGGRSRFPRPRRQDTSQPAIPP